MFEVTKKDDNRLDISLLGPLNADGMRTVLDELIDKSEGMKDGQMLYTITNFSMPTLGAMAVEFTRLPKLFGLLGKFDRCAVVSDTGWIRTAAEVEGALLPGLAIKAFEPGEEVGGGVAGSGLTRFAVAVIATRNLSLCADVLRET